jgi:hypothetical protein
MKLIHAATNYRREKKKRLQIWWHEYFNIPGALRCLETRDSEGLGRERLVAGTAQTRGIELAF